MTPVDAAAYYRRYRVLNGPAIRAREKLRRQQPAVRVARHEADNRRRKRITAAQEPLPQPFQGHDLYDKARRMVGDPWYGTTLYDPLREDAMSEVVLAFLEKRNPKKVLADFMARERLWRVMVVPFFPARG